MLGRSLTNTHQFGRFFIGRVIWFLFMVPVIVQGPTVTGKTTRMDRAATRTGDNESSSSRVKFPSSCGLA